MLNCVVKNINKTRVAKMKMCRWIWLLMEFTLCVEIIFMYKKELDIKNFTRDYLKRLCMFLYK